MLENKVFKATIRTKQREDYLAKTAGGTYMTCIMDWMLKSDQIDQVNWGINASEHWTELDNAEIIHDSTDYITIKLWRKEPDYSITYTIYPNSPFIKIEFLSYKNPQHGWFNVVDLGEPGGQSRKENASVHLFGQENYIRPITYYEESYWNTFPEDKINDPADGGSLNYKGFIISVVENPLNHSGFGRIMPIRTNKNAGTIILKLLANQGFEHFVAANSTVDEFKPFTTWIFLFSEGYEKAINDAKANVDTFFKIDP
jgi:hypothetical protein